MKETITTLSYEMSLMLSELCHGQNASIDQLACLETAIYSELSTCVNMVRVYARHPRRIHSLNAARIRNHSRRLVSTLSYVYRRKIADFDFVLSQIDSDMLSVLCDPSRLFQPRPNGIEQHGTTYTQQR